MREKEKRNIEKEKNKKETGKKKHKSRKSIFFENKDTEKEERV